MDALTLDQIQILLAFETVAAFLVLGHAAVAANLQLGSGARVDDVDVDGAAASAGIQPGDLILAIDGKPINGYSDIDPVVEASSKRILAIDIGRGAAHLRLKVTPRLRRSRTDLANSSESLTRTPLDRNRTRKAE